MIKTFLRKFLTTWHWFCVCYFHGVFGKNQTRILARIPGFSWAFQNHCDFKPFSRILSSNLRKQMKNFSNLSRFLSEKTNRTFDSNSCLPICRGRDFLDHFKTMHCEFTSFQVQFQELWKFWKFWNFKNKIVTMFQDLYAQVTTISISAFHKIFKMSPFPN